ncbi:MAG: hypothetical protein B7Y51_08070 [Burkholderiales bacterium 28-67-8]|nr:MAG: hypothetical protein B7Y51_08070 [Burkholderiales bacterium 28-67-8]
MRLVLASNNAGKLAELQSLFAPLGLSLVCQGDLGIAEADEPHLTFIENALAKARHAAHHAGAAAIADDSGLCVDALGGAPGVRSADDPQPLVALGRWPGVILAEPRGEAGFGYDPLMFIPELQCSVAELSAVDKNARSHRGLASRDMLQQMREVWRLG